jgi:hypothetical protein
MKNKMLKKSLSLPRNMQLLNQNDSSSIFKEIYNRATKKENYNINNFSGNKGEQFLNMIGNMRLREDLIESENDYILKESKNEVRLNQEMLYLFGKRRPDYKKTTKKLGKIKLDKNLFINPLEKKENRNFTKSQNKNKILLKLPIINKRAYNMKSIIQDNKLFNSEENCRKTCFNDSSNINIDESKKNNESKSALCLNKNNKNPILNLSTPRKVKNKQTSCKTLAVLLKKNSLFSEHKSRNKFSVNKTSKTNVINLLNRIKNELITDEKKHKIYFRKHDYGCELSKNKISYLEKNFFKVY